MMILKMKNFGQFFYRGRAQVETSPLGQPLSGVPEFDYQGTLVVPVYGRWGQFRMALT